MAVKLIPPNSTQPIVFENGYAHLRVDRFFVEIANAFDGLMDQGTAVADIAVSTTANNTAKINELLAVLRTAGIIAT